MEDNFIRNIINYIDDNELLSGCRNIIIGVSGGADSVALLTAICQIKDKYNLDKIIAVHINHMIRGAEADRDQYFVEILCEKLGIECRVFYKDIPAYAKELSVTLEEAGRIFRYACFNTVAAEYNNALIAIAHNKNDVAETVLFNIARGSGLKGVTGIAPKRENIIRPILFASRTEIEEYLLRINQEFITDSTNLTLDYDRNKIRYNILPALLEVNNGAIDHICELAALCGASYRYIDSIANKFIDDCGHVLEDSVEFDCESLKKLEAVVREYAVHEALSLVAGVKKDITRKHVCSVCNLIGEQTGKRISLPYGMIARISYDRLIIEKNKESTKAREIVIEGSGEYKLLDETYKVELSQGAVKCVDIKNNYAKVFDYGRINGKPCIRTPRDGDYITIDTNGNTKKLSRVFIDSKVDRGLRNSWPVIAVGSEILWAVGLRYNEAYRVDDKTEKVMYIEYIGGEKTEC